MDFEKINQELEHIDRVAEQKLDHSNVINSNNIIIEENDKEEKSRDKFNILLTVFITVLIMIIMLFIGSFLNGDKLLSN